MLLKGLCISFKEFLLEMETTLQEKDQIREIINNLLKNDKEWFDTHAITVGDKGPYWILNYSQSEKNDYNRLVRGMVVAKPPLNFNGDPLTLIRSFPFIRFFNHGESQASPINFANSEMLEKLDGTMVGIFFPHKDPSRPEFHTRRMVSTHEDDMEKSITTFDGKTDKFLPAIKNFVDKLHFNESDVYFTYVFEFLHEISYVVTKYKPSQYGLYLLGARNIGTHKELTEDKLDEVAKRINAFRPRRWNAVANHSEIASMFKIASADTPDFEGFVFRDKHNGSRVKVKDPAYVEKHHLIDSSSYKRLIPLVLKGEEGEIVAYFPHVKEKIEKFKEAYQKYLEKVFEKIKYWQEKDLSKKDLAVELLGKTPLPKWQLRLNRIQGNVSPNVSKEKDDFIKGVILSFYEIKNKNELKEKIDKRLREIALGINYDSPSGKDREIVGNPKRLIDLIGLNDTDEETNSVGEI